MMIHECQSSLVKIMHTSLLPIQFNLSVGIVGAVYICGTLLFAISTIVAGPLTDRLVRLRDYPCMEVIISCVTSYSADICMISPHLQVPRYLIIVGLVVGCAGLALIGPTKFIIPTPYVINYVVLATNVASVHVILSMVQLQFVYSHP